MGMEGRNEVQEENDGIEAKAATDYRCGRFYMYPSRVDELQ